MQGIKNKHFKKPIKKQSKKQRKKFMEAIAKQCKASGLKTTKLKKCR